MELVVSALAVLWAWEYLLLLCPVIIPAWVQPALVVTCALGARHIPGSVLHVMAVAGGVALLHRLLARPVAPHVMVRQRSRRLPPL